MSSERQAYRWMTISLYQTSREEALNVLKKPLHNNALHPVSRWNRDLLMIGLTSSCNVVSILKSAKGTHKLSLATKWGKRTYQTLPKSSYEL